VTFFLKNADRYDIINIMHSVVIIDDHPLIRRGFASYLAETGRFSIAGEAGTLQDAYMLFKNLSAPPQLVLLDIELGNDNGLDLIDFLNKRYPRPRKIKDSAPVPSVLVYSIFEDPYRVQAALHLGARGFVSKSAKEEEIVTALEAVLNNEIYVEPKLEQTSENKDFYQSLTRQERKILALVQKNYDNRSIARELALGLRTVENYLTRIYTKTGVSSRGELVKL
jgi:NarL family two-component system response regulator LiaR